MRSSCMSYEPSNDDVILTCFLAIQKAPLAIAQLKGHMWMLTFSHYLDFIWKSPCSRLRVTVYAFQAQVLSKLEI